MSQQGGGGGTGLRAIVTALGGDLYAGGRRANVPAPGHSPADRSVSLRLAGDRLLVHSFGAADWREVVADLRRRRLIDADNRVLGAAGTRAGGEVVDAPPLRAERVAAARRLWEAAGPVTAGSPAGLHGVRRGLTAADLDRAALRAHAAAPTAAYRPGGRRHPALLAAVHAPGGALTAVELTYLTWSGVRRRMAVPRKLVGVLPAGSAVRLAEAAAEMLVAEGVFTTLSAMRLLGLPGWALLGANNLARWTPPAEVRRVVIAADAGAVGLGAADRLRATLVGAGVWAQVRPPPPGLGDWNDALLAKRGAAG